MKAAPTLRELQRECKALPRSLRLCMPVIAKTTGYSVGMVRYCLDGYSGNTDTLKAILNAARAILDNPIEPVPEKMRRVGLKKHRGRFKHQVL